MPLRAGICASIVRKHRVLPNKIEGTPFVLGKPGETVDPDRVDVDEWEKLQ